MSKTRRGKGRHRPTQTARNTPEALAPQDTPIDIVFDPVTPEISWIDEEIAKAGGPVETTPSEDIPDAESLLAVDDDQVIEAEEPIEAEESDEPVTAADPMSEELSLEDAKICTDAGTQVPEEPMVPEQEEIPAMPIADDQADGNADAEVQQEDAGEPAQDDLGGTEDVPEVSEPVDAPKVGGGDVLDDQTALFEADAAQMEETDQSHVPEDQMPVDPEPHEAEEITNDQPDVERDDKEKKPSALLKIPLIGPVIGLIGDYIHKVKEFKRTFYDDKYWKRPKGIHGNMVRNKMLKRGWVYLHRMWWDNSLQSYRDDIIFVKQSDLTKQNPKHLSKWGERALPDPSTGEWLIFNSKIIPPEYENESGFTASSAYLCMMDTSGEKAVKEATIDLKSGNHMDRFFLILIGGAFVIIFAFFLMGGFK